nr:hypothetical protein Q903MT_gene5852 [Picea sitchensis]
MEYHSTVKGIQYQTRVLVQVVQVQSQMGKVMKYQRSVQSLYIKWSCSCDLVNWLFSCCLWV